MTTAEKTALKRELKQAFSRAIKELREKAPQRPSQQELAEAAGMDRTYWGDLERGERSLTLFKGVFLGFLGTTVPIAAD